MLREAQSICTYTCIEREEGKREKGGGVGEEGEGGRDREMGAGGGLSRTTA